MVPLLRCRRDCSSFRHDLLVGDSQALRWGSPYICKKTKNEIMKEQRFKQNGKHVPGKKTAGSRCSKKGAAAAAASGKQHSFVQLLFNRDRKEEKQGKRAKKNDDAFCRLTSFLLLPFLRLALSLNEQQPSYRAPSPLGEILPQPLFGGLNMD